jgi:hypothetical protein
MIHGGWQRGLAGNDGVWKWSIMLQQLIEPRSLSVSSLLPPEEQTEGTRDRPFRYIDFNLLKVPDTAKHILFTCLVKPHPSNKPLNLRIACQTLLKSLPSHFFSSMSHLFVSFVFKERLLDNREESMTSSSNSSFYMQTSSVI